MQPQYQCANCGAPIAFGSRFCGTCGTQLNWPTQQQVQLPPPQYNQYPYQQQGQPPPQYYQSPYQQQWAYGYQQQKPKQQSSSWPLVILLLVGITLLVVGSIYLGTALPK
jgi:hypothetical protein